MTLVSNGPDPQRIRSMFASIATRYDRANTILSGGIHRSGTREVTLTRTLTAVDLGRPRPALEDEGRVSAAQNKGVRTGCLAT